MALRFEPTAICVDRLKTRLLGTEVPLPFVMPSGMEAQLGAVDERSFSFPNWWELSD